MPWILLGLLLLALVFGPSLWVGRIMRRYSQPTDRYPGTGAQLVRHLARELDLDDLRVERTEAGDHYDPHARAIRLTPDKHDGRSLTAITVAAHEFGHALQDAEGYPPLRVRTRLAGSTRWIERLGVGLMIAAPFLAAITRAPAVGGLSLIGGLLSLGASALVHVVTLPTEFDASFNRALPLLNDGGILEPADRPHARRLLTAAAFTYVAASLMSLLNVARWWALLRR